jgi:hypothetical protein
MPRFPGRPSPAEELDVSPHFDAQLAFRMLINTSTE